jgi:hypothetical protein
MSLTDIFRDLCSITLEKNNYFKVMKEPLRLRMEIEVFISRCVCPDAEKPAHISQSRKTAGLPMIIMTPNVGSSDANILTLSAKGNFLA